MSFRNWTLGGLAALVLAATSCKKDDTKIFLLEPTDDDVPAQVEIPQPIENPPPELEAFINPFPAPPKAKHFLPIVDVTKLIQPSEEEQKRYALSLYGMHPNEISKIPEGKVNDLAQKLQLADIPFHLRKHITVKPKNYSLVIAQEVRGKRDTKALKSEIINKITARDYCYRADTDYIEDISQVDTINDVNILSAIKGYIDYLDRPENVRKMFGTIDDDLAETQSELGGVVVQTIDGYSFELCEPRAKLDNIHYRGHGWMDLIGKIGDFHLHATSENDTEWCGPSGSAIRKETSVDFGSIRENSKTNPYQVDIVITKLEGCRFNADVYFINPDTDNGIVLDLGSYELPPL